MTGQRPYPPPATPALMKVTASRMGEGSSSLLGGGGDSFPTCTGAELGVQIRRGYGAPLELGGRVTAEGAKSTRFKSMHLFGGQEAITSMRDAYTHRSASLQGLRPSSLVAFA